MDKQNSKFRWVVFATVMFTYLLIASQRTAPGLITNQLMADFNITASTVGLLISVQFFLYTVLQIPMGILADRYGPNLLLIIGTTITGLGTILYSLGNHEIVLFISRVLIGTGDATIWVNMVLILNLWFKAKEFVKLIGLAGMTGSLGFLLATVPFTLWIGLLGWRLAFFFTGLLLCLCGSLLYFVLIKKQKQIFVEEYAAIENKMQRETLLTLLRRIFSNKQAWALFLCHFGIVGGYIGFIGSWAVPYGMDVYGIARSDASQLIMIGLVGALIGAPLASWISSRLDTIKRPYLIIHSIVLLSWGSFLLFNGSPPLPILIILFFIVGFGFGSSALTFAAVRQSFPVKDAGFVSGFVNTGGFLSAAILPSMLGYILDFSMKVTGSSVDGYYYGFIIIVIFSALGLLGVLLIHEKQPPKHLRFEGR
ncbi:MFS transporter [Desulfuribacillus alkaliarsenatis]|uniref:MFS transporter n=1 Tax=Desulfuribacillus alkaliarsenatis TaxID=766136 RepID=A0A1E5G2A6_9FIRM|nr:MFS transporter [Desulfuribacillus alkaliarsenatis]OEF96671.1 MFS transporter [Desulfuribacillus alkaliarsenatis]